ncbi:hypothetical protein LUZ60_009076 [Juncus effusus]|nr:hypothetical protein LUZ60_009076 [Juncus effusus]
MATSHPNPNRKVIFRKEQRNWAELNGDLLILIFRMVGTIDVLKNAGFVCCSWQKVAKDDPELWRRIDMTHHGYEPSKVYILKDLTKLAIDRSRGRLEEFWIESFCDGDLLHYLCDRYSIHYYINYNV